jgi:ATP-dependent helicase/nuclease subunit A
MSDIELATSPTGNFIVHAAAGTGKTWLLTSRIIRLLLAGAEPGSILAISFTRKAAAEIQERVLSRLLRLAGGNDSALDRDLGEIGCQADAETRAMARNLYEKVLTADQPLRVTTFHAFCQDLLQRFPLESGIPPGFQIIESTTELEDLAWQGFEGELRKNRVPDINPAMDTLLRLTSSPAAARAALMAFLAHRSDWWAFTETAPDAVAHAQRHLSALLNQAGAEETGSGARTDLKSTFLRYAQLLGKHDNKTNQGIVKRIERALEAPDTDGAWLALRPGVFTDSKGQRKSMKSSAVLVKKLGQDDADELLRLHDMLADELDQLQDRHLARSNLERNQAWLLCGNTLLEIFQALKRQQQVLDFSDLEWCTYKLLTDSNQAQWVQYKLDQRIDHLLVDEFQDTNPTQWHLIQPLLDEMAAGQMDRNRSAFIVGDIKQSIYRFRRAAPDLFHHARDWLLLNMDATSATQHKSYRSSPAVVEFVNLVFHQADSSAGNHYHLHDFARHEAHHQQRWGHVELLPLVRRFEDETGDSDHALRNPLARPRSQLESMTERQHEREATMIVDKIKSLIGQPIVVNDVVQPIDYRDIMILLRSRTHAAIYETALRQADIPFSGSGKSQFHEAIEIRDMLHLLQALITPFDNLALASALRSPVFSCSNQDLADLACEGGNWWRDRLAKKAQTLSDSTPLARAYRLISNWRQRVDRVPVHDLLDSIYTDANIVERYLHATPEYLRSRVESNLNTLLELALEADAGRYPSLTRFITKVSALSEDDVVTSSVTSDSRVRILTIHGAKGLESPIVFVADSARTSSEPPAGFHAVIDWPAASDRPEQFLLVGKKEVRDTVSQQLLADKQMADRREEANLLYVALTRAGQHLYISGCEPKSGDNSWYQFITARIDAERSALEKPLPGFHTQFGAEIGIGELESPFVFSYGQPTPIAKTQDVTGSPDVNIDIRLRQPIPDFTTSRIINPSAADEYSDSIIPGKESGTTELARQRGIWTHRALEFLPGHSNREQLYRQLRQESEPFIPTDAFEACWQQACRIVDEPRFEGYFNPGLFEATRNEMPILYFHEGNPVYGIIDRVVLTGNQVIVIDYKTHASANTGNIKALAQPYFEQMRFYADGVSKLWPDKAVSLVLLFTECAEVIEIPYPADT